MAGAAAGLLASSRFAAAATRLDLYTSSDANISDFFNNVVKPAFEAANPGLELNVVIARPQAALDAVVQRAFAALSTKSDPQLDMIEQYEPMLPNGGIEAGLWTDFQKAGLANYGAVNKLAIQTAYGLPYRGSQVLLAYDSTKAAEGQGAEDLRGPRRLDQGQPRSVHLQSSRQGRFGRQLHQPRRA